MLDGDDELDVARLVEAVKEASRTVVDVMMMVGGGEVVRRGVVTVWHNPHPAQPYQRVFVAGAASKSKAQVKGMWEKDKKAFERGCAAVGAGAIEDRRVAAFKVCGGGVPSARCFN